MLIKKALDGDFHISCLSCREKRSWAEAAFPNRPEQNRIYESLISYPSPMILTTSRTLDIEPKEFHLCQAQNASSLIHIK